MKNLLVFALFILFLSSCKKNIIQQQLQTSNTNDKNISAKISSSAILSTTYASQIPVQIFTVDPKYKTAYFHLKQPNEASCSWTTYVNCINCVVTANNSYCYPTAISTVRYRCQNYYPQTAKNGASYILALAWYAYTYDKGFICCLLKSTTHRWIAIKEMLKHLSSHKTPFVVSSSRNNLIHYNIIFSIDWQQSEHTSIVYYTDCAYANEHAGVFNKNIQSMSLYNFLNLMSLDTNNYTMLFMWPK